MSAEPARNAAAEPATRPPRTWRTALAAVSGALALVAVAALIGVLILAAVGGGASQLLTFTAMIAFPIAALGGAVLLVDGIRSRTRATDVRRRTTS